MTIAIVALSFVLVASWGVFFLHERAAVRDRAALIRALVADTPGEYIALERSATKPVARVRREREREHPDSEAAGPKIPVGLS